MHRGLARDNYRDKRRLEAMRAAEGTSYLREAKTDNGYARPIEGLIVHFDNGR